MPFSVKATIKGSKTERWHIDMDITCNSRNLNTTRKPANIGQTCLIPARSKHSQISRDKRYVCFLKFSLGHV